MYSRAGFARSIVTSTSATSIRGSQRRSADRTSAPMAFAVSLSADANRYSWIRQPNSGRMGRSPGEVPRIRRIASSISRSRDTRAMPPVASTRSGKAQPRPMNCSLTSSPARSVDLHRGALEREVARGLDLQGATGLEGHVAVGVHRDLARARDLQLLVLVVEDDVHLAVRGQQLDPRVARRLDEHD